MKIGDAGETFFVFETEEDIPDDLVTSPLLTPTSTTPQEDIPPAKSDIPELDLNATPQDQSWTQRQRVQSAPETPSSDDATPVPCNEEEVAGPSVEYRDGTSLQQREVHFLNACPDVALDMAGYHSPLPTQPSWQSHQHETKDTGQPNDHHPFHANGVAQNLTVEYHFPNSTSTSQNVKIMAY